ncbi:MAG: hypothetical protein ACOX81_03835 [Candidatus Heteroscillospira sp.]
MKKAAVLIMLLLILAGCGERRLSEPEYKEEAGALPEYSEEDMLSQSNIIALGTVKERSEPFDIIPVGGGTSASFADCVFEIGEQFKGGDAGELTVRVRCGEYAPELEPGEEYLLFLSKVDMGGGYNTKGDYYIVFRGNQGVFEPNGDGEYRSAVYDELIQPEGLTGLSSEGVSLRGEFIENQRRNLENGFITQEEYDAAIASLDVYAEIVE